MSFRLNYGLKMGRVICSLGVVIINYWMASPGLGLPLSPGDRLEVSIPNEEYFTGVYDVNQDGNLEIPYLGLLPVLGLEPIQVQQKLTQALIDQQYFPPDKLQLSVQMLRWAPIAVTIKGEVFNPGRVLINEDDQEPEETIFLESRQITGDYPTKRYLTDAIRASGGILPSADLRNVQVIRADKEIIVDLLGVFSGEPVQDIPLVAGDRIIVSDLGEWQPELVRPSQITPPGIKVFVSNLSVPATSNANAAVRNEQEGITFPYGARFSHAVIAGNCAGGTETINADRKAILVRTNRLSGETIAIERKVEDLLRQSQSDENNPFLMPRDGVACYDSDITNIRDIFDTINDFLSPLNPILILRNLFQ